MRDRSSTADALHSAAIHVLRAARRSDGEEGLSPARLSMLSVVVFGGPASVKDLASAEGIASPSATSLLNALESAGLVRRRPSPRDGRSILVDSTAKGRATLERARQRRLARLEQLLAPLEDRDLPTIDRAAHLLLGLVHDVSR